MVSSKELSEILRLLLFVAHEDKEILLNYLSFQQDSGDSSWHPSFSPEKAAK